jgi:hypothetical protein
MPCAESAEALQIREGQVHCSLFEEHVFATANLGEVPRKQALCLLRRSELLIARGDASSRDDGDLCQVKL